MASNAWTTVTGAPRRKPVAAVNGSNAKAATAGQTSKKAAKVEMPKLEPLSAFQVEPTMFELLEEKDRRQKEQLESQQQTKTEYVEPAEPKKKEPKTISYTPLIEILAKISPKKVETFLNELSSRFDVPADVKLKGLADFFEKNLSSFHTKGSIGQTFLFGLLDKEVQQVLLENAKLLSLPLATSLLVFLLDALVDLAKHGHPVSNNSCKGLGLRILVQALATEKSESFRVFASDLDKHYANFRLQPVVAAELGWAFSQPLHSAPSVAIDAWSTLFLPSLQEKNAASAVQFECLDLLDLILSSSNPGDQIARFFQPSSFSTLIRVAFASDNALQGNKREKELVGRVQGQVQKLSILLLKSPTAAAHFENLLDLLSKGANDPVLAPKVLEYLVAALADPKSLKEWKKVVEKQLLSSHKLLVHLKTLKAQPNFDRAEFIALLESFVKVASRLQNLKGKAWTNSVAEQSGVSKATLTELSVTCQELQTTTAQSRTTISSVILTLIQIFLVVAAGIALWKPSFFLDQLKRLSEQYK